MLKSISWQNFLITTGVLIAGWYLIMGVWFYAKDLKGLILKIINGRSRSEKVTSGFGQEANHYFGESGNDLFSLAIRLRDEIRNLLDKAASERFPREEMIMALQLRLRDYPQLNHTAFQVAINNFIALESESKCSTPLSEDDMRVLWMG